MATLDAATARGDSAVLYDAHPRMFRNAPFAFVLAVLAIALAGLGIIILMVWWLRCLSDRLTILPGKVIWTHGLLAKDTTEIGTTSIRSVRINQTVTQRIFNTGTVSIFTAGDQPELKVNGLPEPERIRRLLDRDPTND
jgi:uncharacterized membrane protein YdbT with pleckstrin-like domain